MMHRLAFRTINAFGLLCFVATSAPAAPPLRQLGKSPSAAASDGGRFVAWLRADGRVAVYDTSTARRRVTGEACAALPAVAGGRAVVAGDGLAVVTCGAPPGGTPSQVSVDLRSDVIRPLSLPPQSSVGVVGRFWLAGATTPGSLYVNRRDGSATTYPRSSYYHDPDTRELAAVTVGGKVTRLLLDGSAYVEGDANRLAVFDPRLKRTVIVVSRCDPFCGSAFGRVGRLAYTRYGRGTWRVVVKRRGRRDVTWRLRPGVAPDDGAGHSLINEARLVQPSLTRNAVVVSTYRDREFVIAMARL